MKNFCWLLLFPCFVRGQLFQYNPRFIQTCWQGHFSPSLDPFLSMDHPAALADMTETAMGIKSEKFPGVEASGNLQAVLFFPFESWKLSTWYDAWRGAGLNRQELGLNLARNIGQSDVGVQFNHELMSIKGIGKDRLVSGRIEWWWRLTQQVGAGLSIHHPFGARFLKLHEEKPAFATSFNMAWKASSQFSTNFQIVKEEGRAFDMIAGIQFWAEKSLLLRASVSTFSAQPSLMASWRWKKIMIGSSFRFQSQLGLHGGLMILYYPNNITAVE